MIHALVFRLFSFFLIIQTTYQTAYPCDSNAPCGCSEYPVNTNARIVNGEDAAFNTWSWAVSLEVGDSLCGGTIIDESYVMTAAHCVAHGLKPSEIKVHAGSINFLEGTSRSVSQIYSHPRYNETEHTNDIALLKLDRPFDLSSVNLAKVCLPNVVATSEEYPTPSTSLVAVGWGTLWWQGPLSKILQQVTIRVEGAETLYCRNVIKDPLLQLCAGVMPGGEKDTCQGDSGGPLMMFNSNQRWELIGVVSYGIRCAVPRLPGVYTRVSSYIEWINTIIPHGLPTTTYKPSTTKNTAGPTIVTEKTTTDVFGNSASSVNINACFLFSFLIFVFNY